MFIVDGIIAIWKISAPLNLCPVISRYSRVIGTWKKIFCNVYYFYNLDRRLFPALILKYVFFYYKKKSGQICKNFTF